MRLNEEKRFYEGPGGRQRLLVLRPEAREGKRPGVLWIHGGGYMTGFPGMVWGTCGSLLARRYGAVVLAPEYRLAWKAPYPAALEDCYAALLYLNAHREELGVDRIVVGGESAGGGLAAALCLYARDLGEVPVCCQLPLYPMLDCEDTPSSRDNHGHGWDTRRNHWGWRNYLGPYYGAGHVPAYASPARADDLRGLPPCFTFVLDGEPFFDETLTYVKRLQAAGVRADAAVLHGNLHGFDALFWTEKSKSAREMLCEFWEEVVEET